MGITSLITGASGGIGRECAEIFAKHCDTLILVCRKRRELLHRLCADLSDRHDVCCHPYVCDLGQRDAVDGLFNYINEKGLAPEIIVNCAGVSHIGLMQDTSRETWYDIINSNLTSAFEITRAAIPGMLSLGRGRIINISSIWGCAGASCEAAYSASKGGLDAFTRAAAKELAPSNIQVNALACGLIDTEMNSHLSPDELDSLIRQIPAGRMGSATEAAMAAWLLATAPEYLTGQVIRMDGGWI